MNRAILPSATSRSARSSVLALVWLALLGRFAFAAMPQAEALELATKYYVLAAQANQRGFHNPSKGGPEFETAVGLCAKISEVLADFHDASAETIRTGSFYHAGMAQYYLGNFSQAFSSFNSYRKSNAKKADEEVAAYLPYLKELEDSGYIRLRVAPSTARVRIDGTERKPGPNGWIAIQVPPTDHVLQVDSPGHTTREVAFNVGLREAREIKLELESTISKPEPSWHPTAAWISAGVGGVGLVAGVICLVVADGKDQAIADLKDENGLIVGAPRQAEARELASDRDSFQTFGVVGLVTAGLGAVAATIFFLLPDERPLRDAREESDSGYPLVRLLPLGGGGLLQVETDF